MRHKIYGLWGGGKGRDFEHEDDAGMNGISVMRI